MRSATWGLFDGVLEEFSEKETLEMFKKMCDSRYFEEGMGKFIKATGEKNGVKTVFYPSFGQESISAALATVFPEAILFPQHRCHDIYLAWGGDPEALADEVMSLPTGCTGGRGGSASIHIPNKMPGHDGFMGTEVPDGLGRALRSRQACIAFMGDASAEEGYVLGSEGVAATKRAPVLFVCLDNDLSIQTKVATRRAWRTTDVARAFGMTAFDMTDDPWLIMRHFKNLNGKLPAFFNIYTCRNLHHNNMKCDGPPEWDRFELTKKKLNDAKLFVKAERVELDARVKMNSIWEKRLHEFKKTYVQISKISNQKKPTGRTCADAISDIIKKHLSSQRGIPGGQCLTAAGNVRGTIPELNEGDVFEASMDDTSWTAIMVGMASKDFRPIIIIRFQGFLWFNAEAIANRAGISKYMWNEPRPVLVRAIARDGGIGPVASGSHYSLLTRKPGVYVYAPMTPKEYDYGYEWFMGHDDPMLLSEHISSFNIDYEMEDIVHEKADITIFAVSSTRLGAIEALPELEKEGIICNLIHVKWLKPFDISEKMRLALGASKTGLFLDGDFENGHMKCMAHDLTMATGKLVHVLGLEEHHAGFSSASDNLPPTKEKIIQKVKALLSPRCTSG